MPALTDAAGALLELVLPARCAGCGQREAVVCPACAAALTRFRRECRVEPAPRGLPRCAAAGGYAGSTRHILLAYKEGGRRELHRQLGRAQAAAVRVLLPPVAAPRRLLLVPVPSAPAAVRRRGMDHLRVLAGAAARDLNRSGWAVRVAPVLQLAAHPADQGGLGGAARAANVRGAFAATSPRQAGPPPPCLVLDDILTTGATVAEAARALRLAGWPVAGAAVVAISELRGVDSSLSRARRAGGTPQIPPAGLP